MKDGLGDAKAGNSKFIKETIDKLIGFWRVILIEKYGPGGAKAGNSKVLKEFYK